MYCMSSLEPWNKANCHISVYQKKQIEKKEKERKKFRVQEQGMIHVSK